MQVLCQLRLAEVTVLIDFMSDWAELVGLSTPEQGLWIYSLMARVEKPLDPDTCRFVVKIAVLR